MKKTYWWRVVTSFLAITGVFIGYIIFYPHRYGLCMETEYCIFSSLKKTFAEPLFIVAMFSFPIAILLFIVNDIVFKKWLRFAMIWMVLAIVAIIISPKTSHDALFTIDKEMVSIWMGSLFAIFSVIILAYQSFKLRRK